MIQAITKVSQDNLWLLAYALKALKDSGWEAVDQELILKQVEKDLNKIYYDNGKNYLYPKLLLALSVLYRFEMPTDFRFLEDTFPEAKIIMAKFIAVFKISSYPPFPCEFYFNGHNAIKQHLEKKGIDYSMKDNAFT